MQRIKITGLQVYLCPEIIKAAAREFSVVMSHAYVMFRTLSHERLLGNVLLLLR